MSSTPAGHEPIPFFKATISEKAIAAVEGVLRSGWLTTGRQAAMFEEEFADHIGGDVEAVAVNSATAGLHLCLEACGVGPGDEVVVPTLTFTATAEVVAYLGAKVVLVDVSPETLCADPGAIRAAVTERTKAVMFVHMGGFPFDLGEISAFCRERGIRLIEDAAHATPTYVGNRHVGSFASDAAVFSFYANKTMTTGEGGMIVTRDGELAARCRLMRTHGIDRDAFARFTTKAGQWQYDVVEAGYKYNLTDIAAALGRVQLEEVHAFCDGRTAAARYYTHRLAGRGMTPPPQPNAANRHSWHLYPVMFASGAERDRAIACFAERGIGYSVHYTPLHRLTHWSREAILDPGGYPVADDYFSRCLSLPLFPEITRAQQDSVIDAIEAALAG